MNFWNNWLFNYPRDFIPLSSCLLSLSQVVYSVTSQFISVIYHSWILQSVSLHTGIRQATQQWTSWGLREKSLSVSKREAVLQYNKTSISVTGIKQSSTPRWLYCYFHGTWCCPPWSGQIAHPPCILTSADLQIVPAGCVCGVYTLCKLNLKCLYLLASDRQQISYLPV